MSLKTMSWALLASLALAAILLFNYWASFQPLSTLAYAGLVTAVGGLANVIVPFRFLGIRKRYVGVVMFASGVVLALTALLWPAPMLRVAHHRTLLDDLMPEYQFSEQHSERIHAKPEQVMSAIRDSTWSDLRSLRTLLRIRGAASRESFQENSYFSPGRRVSDAFAASGYVFGGNDHEFLMCGGANVQAQRPLQLRSLQEFADYREQGGIKMAFDFYVEDTGGGWSRLTAETRVLALDASTRRGMGGYWRLIVPGSGLLRRQWLDGIKKRAESIPGPKL